MLVSTVYIIIIEKKINNTNLNRVLGHRKKDSVDKVMV